jgi:hypothetical protein
VTLSVFFPHAVVQLCYYNYNYDIICTGVTPMMTAQAANQDEIITWLNKALDIGTKYEDSYIPSKKVPVCFLLIYSFHVY